MTDKNPYLSNLIYLRENTKEKMIVGLKLLEKIERSAHKHQAKLIIIDNISKLLPDALKPDVASFLIATLNRVQERTGASILVIGHTTKGNPKVCIQPPDYYGSAMLQNFFTELSFLDKTKDGNFFLCHSKTKHKECYDTTVPVFSRGDHSRFGLGFTYLYLQQLSDIQMPYAINPAPRHRPRNLTEFRKEIACLLAHGFTQSNIARFLDVTQQSISHLLNST